MAVSDNGSIPQGRQQRACLVARVVSVVRRFYNTTASGTNGVGACGRG